MQNLSGASHLFRIDELASSDRWIVVNKPSGMAVHKGWAADPVNAVKLVRRLTRRKVHPVHRLDRGTSGALLFAFDPEMVALLQEGFREKAVQKRYLALVRGVTPEDGVIDHPVPKRPKGPRIEALTRFRRLGVALDRFSLVECFPETGRLHQIRRHMKHLGHPLIGDTAYGDGKENRRLREEVQLLRLALHALELRFVDPLGAEVIVVHAPPPDDLRVPLERLGFEGALFTDEATRARPPL